MVAVALNAANLFLSFSLTIFLSFFLSPPFNVHANKIVITIHTYVRTSVNVMYACGSPAPTFPPPLSDFRRDYVHKLSRASNPRHDVNTAATTTTCYCHIRAKPSLDFSFFFCFFFPRGPPFGSVARETEKREIIKKKKSFFFTHACCLTYIHTCKQGYITPFPHVQNRGLEHEGVLLWRAMLAKTPAMSDCEIVGRPALWFARVGKNINNYISATPACSFIKNLVSLAQLGERQTEVKFGH